MLHRISYLNKHLNKQHVCFVDVMPLTARSWQIATTYCMSSQICSRHHWADCSVMSVMWAHSDVSSIFGVWRTDWRTWVAQFHSNCELRSQLDICCMQVTDFVNIHKTIFMIPEVFTIDQSLQHPAVCLWRVTGLWISLLPSVMNLDLQTQSKITDLCEVQL